MVFQSLPGLLTFIPPASVCNFGVLSWYKVVAPAGVASMDILEPLVFLT